MATQFYAHSVEGSNDRSGWEPLETHLHDVAQLAGDFAGKWGARPCGYLAGLWHDLGKYSHEFQTYLNRANGFEAHLETLPGRVDHSTAGAQHAECKFKELQQPYFGRLLAYCIAGHHAGLADWIDEFGSSGLRERLAKNVPSYETAPHTTLCCARTDPPRLTLATTDRGRAAFQMSFLCRMLFSCLVDADYLATEKFLDPERSGGRQVDLPSLDVMASQLSAHLNDLKGKAPKTEVNARRSEILAACRAAAEWEPGLFSLTVPTGGGKTLASLAFALEHAVAHPRRQLQRVIYAIPFTSIIEQTADTFRDVFGPLSDRTVLEHHSNLDPERETSYGRLAAENWDAPLVVTTNVQFFESLFAARTSRCRKLHRIARSIIILDEVQTLPIELLTPCLAVLRELANEPYGCTIVLCTATQPAVTHRPEFKSGLEGVREIIPEPQQLYCRMKRTTVENIGHLDDATLLEHLTEHRSFLCIVNTRSHAAKLFEALRGSSEDDPEGLFHLSTWMCGAHRAEVIATIRELLNAGSPCRVVSTQLIEAGVDVDFPVVFRALSGVDSIAQAAGRCNREGGQQRGMVYVFEPQEVRLRGLLASTAATTAELLPDFDDLLSLDAVEKYFQLHYWKYETEWDKRAVMGCFALSTNGAGEFYFKQAAKRFRMIEDEGQSVLVPWRKVGQRLIERLMQDDFLEPHERRSIQREAQRYAVSLYDGVFRALLGTDIEIRHESFPVLLNSDMYDKRLGLNTENAGYHEPDSLIAAF